MMVDVLPHLDIVTDDEGETIHFSLGRREALAIAQLIQREDTRTPFGNRGGERLRGLAQRIVTMTRPKTESKHGFPNAKVNRPSNQYPSEIDRDHALNGVAPYPVLCLRDLYTVYPLLEEKGLKAPDIAERIHVDERTIYRWRKNPPEWMEGTHGKAAETW